MCYTPITARVIQGAAKLKGIVKYGVGIDAIDIEAARARKIPVVNIPEYAEETVAEGAFALMLALAKKLIPIHEAVQKDGWAWPTARWLGSDLAEKTIGLVGTGRIGRNLARMAGAGFRARVLGCDPNVSEATMRAHRIEKQDDLKTMLAKMRFCFHPRDAEPGHPPPAWRRRTCGDEINRHAYQRLTRRDRR